MIFLTVGTSFPFDRLVQAMDEHVSQGRIDPDIFAQVGKGGYRPRNFESVETLDKGRFDEYFEKAEAVIAHAGMGTITMALERHKPILVMPRLKKYRELVNDHQLATAKHFEQLGHVIAAYDINELPEKLNLLKSFQPAPRGSQVDKVAERIGTFLHQCLSKK
jgi:UDP-N-acetylglucosamine transferase subunit ALG13